MGYGNTPSWVYKREMSNLRASHDQEISQLFSKNQELERENQTLKARIEELELEINELRKYKFNSLEKDNI